MGYQFPNTSWITKPTIRLNISNLTNQKYRNPSSFNVTNAKAYGTAGARTVFYYMGSPRFASVTLSGNF
jgi:iron complex outermembrane receptor protein